MIEEQVTAELISFGAHSSRVRYFYSGTEYDEIVMNEDFIPYDELGIQYETMEEDND
jgi:hypothetical protein